MSTELQAPCLKITHKCELLLKLSERYPTFNLPAVEIMTMLQEIAKKLTAITNEQLAEFGLSEGKFYVLAYLFSEELMGRGDPSPSDIADNIGVTRATITGLLDGLERDGYLTRRLDTHDRRGLTIGMTDKTKDLLDRFIPTSSCSGGQIQNALSADEQQTLISLLAKLDTALCVPSAVS